MQRTNFRKKESGEIQSQSNSEPVSERESTMDTRSMRRLRIFQKIGVSMGNRKEKHDSEIATCG